MSAEPPRIVQRRQRVTVGLALPRLIRNVLRAVVDSWIREGRRVQLRDLAPRRPRLIQRRAPNGVTVACRRCTARLSPVRLRTLAMVRVRDRVAMSYRA